MMKNRCLLFLLCISLLANSFGQKKENSQTKSESTTVVTQQNKTVNNGKKGEKPTVTIPGKNRPNTNKKKPSLASPSSNKNTATNANTHDQKKPLATSEDSIHNNKSSKGKADSNEKAVFPVVKDTTNLTENSDIKENSASSFNYLFLLPYLVIAILIGLLVRLYSRSDKKINHLEREIRQAKESNEYQVSNFKSQLKKLQGENKGLEDDLESVKKNLKNAIREKSKEISEDLISSAPIFYEPIPPTKEESPIRFARYADQGDGFASSELLFEEDNDTIFEIRLTSPKTATFKVANNLNAQKYALSNAGFFLGKTCKYDSTPSQKSIISTEMEGELKLQGGKWLILNPAKITFT